MNILAQALHDKVLMFDGATGTELYRRNFFVNASYENLCLAAPKVILDLHKSYLDAGAEVLTTDSYGANRNKLAKFGLAEKMDEINAAAVRLARQAADGKALAAGSVGPAGDLPAGVPASRELLRKIVADHAASLIKAKPDFIIFETILSLSGLEDALAAMEPFPDMPFLVSMSLDGNARTKLGEPASAAFELIAKAKARPTAFGLNCGCGPGEMLRCVEQVIPLTKLPLVVQPNAGNPKGVDDRMIYMCSPEYFTTYAIRFLNLGVRGIGGCCGTTPAHIADMVRSVRPMAKLENPVRVEVMKEPAKLLDPVPTVEKSALARKLYTHQWVHTIELVPPKGYLLAQTIEKAKLCAEAGFDAINIPDGPRASSNVSSMVTALKIQEGAHIETVLHCCCRDRNLIGMQAELLGCAALGLNNILFITGDPPKLGDYPFASGVFDIDSIGIVKVQSRLNRGADLAGRSIDAPTRAFIAVGADPNAVDFAREIRRTEEKIAAGAEAVITQPVYDSDALFRFMDSVPELKDGRIPLIAGIWPLASYRNAEFMRNEVPGVVVPDSVMARMAAPAAKEDQRQVGIQIAREAVARVKGRVGGVQISAPFGNAATAIAVMKG